MTDPHELARSVFISVFGSLPELAVDAPGRVNLMGEHTDYNDGFVLPCAIDFRTVVVATRRPVNSPRRVCMVAADLEGQRDEIDLDAPIEPIQSKPWANYVRGVVKQLMARGFRLGPVDLVFSGDVPQGAGLSSSASLEVAIGYAFNSLFDLRLDPTQLAILGQEAENQFVGCQSGIMDQLISARGIQDHALLLDCRSLEARPVALPEGMAVLIADSCIERALVGSQYNSRRRECEQAARHFGVKALRDLDLASFEAGKTGLAPVPMKRARHVISENQRTLQAVEALAAADWLQLGALMAASHASMRDDFEITVPPIDGLVDIIGRVLGGVGGARMTGGGFGGCVVALLPRAKVAPVREAIKREYPGLSSGLQADVYVCRPADGARRI